MVAPRIGARFTMPRRAATLIGTIPMILIFAFTERYVLDGITTSAKQG